MRRVFVAAITVLCACSSVRGSRRLDILPFAENTTTMVTEYLRFSRPPPWVYLNAYRNHPAVEAVREARKPIYALMQSVAKYSLQVGAISDSRLSQPRQAQELARFIDEVVRPGIVAGYTTDVGLTVDELEGILADVRASKTLLAAIAAAQPLVEGVLLVAHHHLEIVEGLTERASSEVMADIEREFAPLNRNLAGIERTQDRTVQSLLLLADARLGDREALARVVAEEPELRETLSSTRRPPGSAQLDAASRRLTSRLQQLGIGRTQLEPVHARYVAEVREVHAIRAALLEELRIVRVTLGTWARSHKNLGTGIPVPPAFDAARLLRLAATPVLLR